MICLAFAESQFGPVPIHSFNEAINGVFRATKSESKTKRDKESYQSPATRDSHNHNPPTDKSQKTLKQMLNKRRRQSSHAANFDKENDNTDT